MAGLNFHSTMRWRGQQSHRRMEIVLENPGTRARPYELRTFGNIENRAHRKLRPNRATCDRPCSMPDLSGCEEQTPTAHSVPEQIRFHAGENHGRGNPKTYQSPARNRIERKCKDWQRRRPQFRNRFPSPRKRLWSHQAPIPANLALDRKSTRLNSSHQIISYAVFCLKKKNKHENVD